MGVPQGGGEPHWIEVVHFFEVRDQVEPGAGVVDKVVLLRPNLVVGHRVWGHVHLIQDLLALLQGGGEVVEVLDHLEVDRVVAGRADLAEGAQDARVGAQRELADALGDPGAPDANHQFVLVHAIEHLVPLHFDGGAHEIQHVVIGNPALLVVLTGGIDPGRRGRCEAGGAEKRHEMYLPRAGCGAYILRAISWADCVGVSVFGVFQY